MKFVENQLINYFFSCTQIQSRYNAVRVSSMKEAKEAKKAMQDLQNLANNRPLSIK